MIGDYELLGIQPTATEFEIKNAYNKILGNNHPNKNNGTFDEKKVDSIMSAFRRIMAKQPFKPKTVEEIIFGESADQDFPTMNTLCDNMENKMTILNVNSNVDSPYYSKMSYFVRRDGKVFTKIQENANGNLREYEEYRHENN